MSGGYIYKAVTMPPPDDAQAALNNLNFRVDDNMDVIATWVGEADNPFVYYINGDYELIIGV